MLMNDRVNVSRIDIKYILKLHNDELLILFSGIM